MSGTTWKVFANDTGDKTKVIDANDLVGNFAWSNQHIYPHNGSTLTDATYDVGTSGYRFRHGYFSGSGSFAQVNAAIGSFSGTSYFGQVNAGIGSFTGAATIDGNLLVRGNQVNTGSFNYGADAGSTDDYAITITGITTYTTGMYVCFYAKTANTLACTLNINALGTRAILKRVSTAMASNDILAGMLCMNVYDGTNFILMNPVVN